MGYVPATSRPQKGVGLRLGDFWCKYFRQYLKALEIVLQQTNLEYTARHTVNGQTATHNSTFMHTSVSAVQEAQPAPQAEDNVRVPCGRGRGGGCGFHVQIWRSFKYT